MMDGKMMDIFDDGLKNDGWKNDGWKNDGWKNDGWKNDGWSSRMSAFIGRLSGWLDGWGRNIFSSAF